MSGRVLLLAALALAPGAAAPSPAPMLVPTPGSSFAPTPVPSEPFSAPTPAPSTIFMPTLGCGTGKYYIPASESSGENAVCVPCGIGRSSDTDRPPWPLNCTLCPAGRYNTNVGSAACLDCASGKISSEDRSVCKDCSPGKYSKNDVECVACETGR